MNNNNNNNFDKMTCFEAHKKCNKNCRQKKCSYWQNDFDEHNNCMVNLINQKNDYTLEEIGTFFNVTRMRVCQIEKNAIEKIKSFNQAYLD